MRTGWTEHWDAVKRPSNGLPSKWWRAKHDASGYTVGEVDAGRYMAADERNQGLVDETGDWCAWSHSDDAMEYVERVVANRGT